MAFTEYLKDAVLEHIANIDAFTQPTDLYVGLLTGSDPDTDEVDGGDYERMRPDDDDGRWTVSQGKLENKNLVQFPEATDNWGTITHFAVYDNASEGEALMVIEADESREVNTGDTVNIGVGDISVELVDAEE